MNTVILSGICSFKLSCITITIIPTVQNLGGKQYLDYTQMLVYETQIAKSAYFIVCKS